MDTTNNLTRGPDDGEDLAELTRRLLSTGSFENFLTELVEFASQQTQHSCSITLRIPARDPYTVVSTDEVTLRLDERQYANGTGPCLEALTTQVPVLVDDMATESRWPPYPQQAAALGVRSSMSYPLVTNKDVLGALNMYAFTDLEPDAARNARAAQLADRAAGALAIGLRLADQDAESAGLRVALSSRTVIDQAIGVLMAQQQCTAEEAFAVLRQTSQARNMKLRDVAAEVVASVQRRARGRPRGRY